MYVSVSMQRDIVIDGIPALSFEGFVVVLFRSLNMTWSPHQAAEDVRFLLWSTQPVRSCLCSCGSTKPMKATVTQWWLWGLWGSYEQATWCIWHPPTHIPSIHGMTWARRHTNGEFGGGRGAWWFGGSHSYLRRHPIWTWLTSCTFITASPESLTALTSSSFIRLSKFLQQSALQPQQLSPPVLLLTLCFTWKTSCLQWRFCHSDSYTFQLLLFITTSISEVLKSFHFNSTPPTSIKIRKMFVYRL